MPQNYKITSIISAALIFLVPIFFIPGGALFLDSTKSALFTVGIVVMALSFLFESWKQGSVAFPKSYFVLAAALLPVAYLLSSLIATPSSLSLLGYDLEVGTFGYMLLGTLALFIVSVVYSETSRFLQALVAFFSSFSLLAIFMAVKILSHGNFLVLGNFSGNMGNPLGNWTDLGMAFALLALFSSIVIGMVSMKPLIKWLMYVVFILSTALLVVIGFSTAFVAALVGGVLLCLYFSKADGAPLEAGKRRIFSRETVLPLILTVASLIILINPTVSSTKGKLNDVISNTFHIQNTDVRPTLSATLSISKAVLSQASLLGSGPNTFQHDWLIFKPVNINSTPFWGVAFPYGVGFIPTQVASTGILGSAIWLVFLALLLVLAIKSLLRLPESLGMRFALVSSLAISLFIWIGSTAYSPSSSMLMLGFIFSGIFVAAAAKSGVIEIKSMSLIHPSQLRALSLVAIVLLSAGSVWLGWIGVQRTASAYHFSRAVNLSNTQGASIDNIEGELNKAIALSPVDTHYIALSRLEFAKAQSIATSATGTPEQNQALFQDALSKSVSAAKAAVSNNPAEYQNWTQLGLIYSSLVPAPLKVQGAYENAQFAFSEALKRNPNNPELYLDLARLEIANGNADNARSYIRNAVTLKSDYADAYLLLAQLEISQKNLSGAISSTESLAQLVPNDPGVEFELGILKYSNNDFSGASDALQKAIKLEPNYANAKFYLALSLAKLGQTDEARQILQDLSATNPNNQDLKAALQSLSTSTKKKR